jgi:acetyl esterase/lipase
VLAGAAALALGAVVVPGCRDGGGDGALRLRVTAEAYGTDPNQSGDLHVPLVGGPHPVVVLVHGGYWSVGLDRSAMRPLAEELVQLGYAVWNIDYRRVGEPGGGWPGTLTDVGDAVDHLATLAPANRLDLDKVAVVGHSAGSQLAFWTGARHAQGALAPGGAPVVRPAALASLSGVLDLEAAARLPDEGRLGDLRRSTLAFLGGPPEAEPGRYAVASPLAAQPLGVPQLLLHGVDDEIVPAAQSERFRDGAIAVGDPVTASILAGVDHFDTAASNKAWWAAVINWLPVALGTTSFS